MEDLINAKPKAKKDPTDTVVEPKAKAKSAPSKIIVKEIIKQVPRAKRKPSAFNNFISEQIKTHKKSFTEAISEWNKSKETTLQK